MQYFNCLKLFVCLAFLLFTNIAFGQDEIVPVSKSDFKKNGLLTLGDKAGWVFKPGNDSTWAAVNLSTNGWKKMNPSQITKKLADKNGKLEGWFRFKIKADSSLENLPLNIFYNGIGTAVDIYIDGALFHSFGNKESTDKPYNRTNATKEAVLVPFNILPDREYVFALHYVHESVSFPADLFVKNLDYLFDFNFSYQLSQAELLQDISNSHFTLFFSATVCFILSILFLLLWFQNKEEKILRYIIFSSTLFSLLTGFNFVAWGVPQLSYYGFILIGATMSIIITLILYSIILLFSHVFTNKPPSWHWLIVLLAIVLAVEFLFIQEPAFEGALLLIFFGICLRYIFKAWRNVKGAQWALVTGFLATILSMIAYFINLIITGNPGALLIITIIFLSFPLSLMIYVAIRFKEIISEVRKNADELVLVTEEKRQQALDQQVILEEQVKERTAELSRSLDNLKSTQSQLIHAEKMASLGELTAGIAHEIQNPLNFVNNFSEVSNELIDEMNTELDKGDINEAKVISSDIKQNLEKINHHGKRADAIVKGMLQHSRSSTSAKEPTDINALCNEYLRLSYHGLRAKDKSFNATLKTDFDNSIGKINIIPQDIGRVILNLINNAFYVVDEKNKLGISDYEPTVSISTKKIGDKVEIIVADNGNGIQQKIMEKIFQPFFTTKPTGQGTGLGLSLSYDIITKGHGGEIKIETEEGSGTTFIIQLPVIN